MKKDSYRAFLKEVSLNLVHAQKPIKILASLYWPERVKKSFLIRKTKTLPIIDYQPLKWDTRAHSEMLRQIQSKLDTENPIENAINTRCESYIRTIELLKVRGTKQFHEISRELYGFPDYTYMGGRVSILDLANLLKSAKKGISSEEIGDSRGKVDVETAKMKLSEAIEPYFFPKHVHVRITSKLTADAAAGSNYIKLKKGARYTRRQIRQLACHEGEVHVGTTLNGASQPVLKFLSKGTPETTRFQEGLAVFAEVMSQTLDLTRLQRLADRVIAVKMVEDGADFIEIYHYFLESFEDESDAFDAARRCFRGGVLSGGAPFTKDVVYLDGLVRILNFMRVVMKRHKPEYVRFLFVGKTTPEEIPIIHELYERKMVREPKYIPEWVRDMRFIAAFMNLSAFLNNINLDVVEKYYESIMP